MGWRSMFLKTLCNSIILRKIFHDRLPVWNLLFYAQRHPYSLVTFWMVWGNQGNWQQITKNDKTIPQMLTPETELFLCILLRENSEEGNTLCEKCLYTHTHNSSVKLRANLGCSSVDDCELACWSSLPSRYDASTWSLENKHIAELPQWSIVNILDNSKSLASQNQN